MKIEYRKGDLFSTEIRHITHGCNAQGVMGSGVAKIIRDKYPEAYNAYAGKKWRLGQIQLVQSNDKMIINAITQEFYGRDDKRYVNYDAVALAFEQINIYFDLIPNGILAMPLIGAGLGGGDWKVIEAIIESESTSFQPVVYQL